MSSDIDVFERGGFFHAGRRGTAGQVIHRQRDVAVARAKKWKSGHVQQTPAQLERYLLRHGAKIVMEEEREAYDVTA